MSEAKSSGGIGTAIVKGIFDGLRPIVDGVSDMAKAVMDELTESRTLLKRFGQHRVGCLSFNQAAKTCDCGWAEVAAKLEKDDGWFTGAYKKPASRPKAAKDVGKTP